MGMRWGWGWGGIHNTPPPSSVRNPHPVPENRGLVHCCPDQGYRGGAAGKAYSWEAEKTLRLSVNEMMRERENKTARGRQHVIQPAFGPLHRQIQWTVKDGHVKGCSSVQNFVAPSGTDLMENNKCVYNP